jgi:two-component system osmolarity sensor histidine kinase EnvZ
VTQQHASSEKYFTLPTSSTRRGIYRLVPASFFGRALLILIVPTILVQLLAMYMFYERHWASVTRNMSMSLVNDIALLVDEVRSADNFARDAWVMKAARSFSMGLEFASLPDKFKADTVETTPYPYLFQHMRERVGLPFAVRIMPQAETIRITVKLRDVLMHVSVSRKRLTSPTTYIFTLWTVSTTALLLMVAIIFLRNQIRPIMRLAEAAEAFGTGRDDPNFSPRGAKEIRQAGHAFLRMRARIQRQIQTRTAMLSGISHDLRTPLTRMKLQCAMMNDEHAAKALDADIQTMQHMIEEYLDYARGAGGEESQERDVVVVVDELIARHHAVGAAVSWLDVADAQQSILLPLRKVALQRALDNLITNALRYGVVCRVRVEDSPSHVYIHVQDDGVGIAEADYETVFAPFRRLEVSRNVTTGGVGLGLTIARDIAQAHGGDIMLHNRMDAQGNVLGLEATVRLPKR